MKQRSSQVTEYKGTFRSDDWVALPGGELEGRRPRRLCPACRQAAQRAAANGRSGTQAPLCFECYRLDAARERAIKASGELHTASEARFQTALPFEPVDRARLARLKTARVQVQATASEGIGRFADRRRQAQLAARHALQRIAAGLEARHPRQISASIHAAELQLPESWLPFVVSR